MRRYTNAEIQEALHNSGPFAKTFAAPVTISGGVTNNSRLIVGSLIADIYGIESNLGALVDEVSSNASNRFAITGRRLLNTTSSASNSARSISAIVYGATSGGQVNSGMLSAGYFEAIRNYVVPNDGGTVNLLEGAVIITGHLSQDASTPTTTTVKGLRVQLYRSTGSIGAMYGIHIDNGSTSVIPTTGYGLKIENTIGGEAYAIHSGTGLVRFGDPTDAINMDSASVVLEGGLAVEKAIISGSSVKTTSPSAGIGYGTGAGGTQTQTGSRSTSVTLDKVCGQITLVSAAGSATWNSFTVTNSTVAASDTVRVCQKTGTDKYMTHVTAVAAGSFEITFATTGGTTTEQPVFSFTVFKAVSA